MNQSLNFNTRFMRYTDISKTYDDGCTVTMVYLIAMSRVHDIPRSLFPHLAQPLAQHPARSLAHLLSSVSFFGRFVQLFNLSFNANLLMPERLTSTIPPPLDLLD